MESFGRFGFFQLKTCALTEIKAKKSSRNGKICFFFGTIYDIAKPS